MLPSKQDVDFQSILVALWQTGTIIKDAYPFRSFADRDKYELNVTAIDDGACCGGGGPTHTSTAVVVVFITDVNDNKPVFHDCASYSPKIEEGAPNGSPVARVQATDADKGINGQVRPPPFSFDFIRIDLDFS